MDDEGEAKDIRLLIDSAESTILGAKLSSEPRLTALIALAFCDLLINDMNEEQRQASLVARQYWEEGIDDVHREWVERLARITDFDQRNNASGRNVVVNRLVWTALNTHPEFDGYACEFLVILGARAGLKAGQMQEALSKYIRAS